MNSNEKIDGVSALQRLKNSFTQYAGILAALAVIIVAAAIINPVFLNWGNIVNMIVNSSTIGLAGFGMTFVILTGGIDLSSGKMAALVGVFAADLLQKGMPVYLVIPLGIVLGYAVGMGVGSAWLSVVGVALILYVLVDYAIMPGQKSTNRYGPRASSGALNRNPLVLGAEPEGGPALSSETPKA